MFSTPTESVFVTGSVIISLGICLLEWVVFREVVYVPKQFLPLAFEFRDAGVSFLKLLTKFGVHHFGHTQHGLAHGPSIRRRRASASESGADIIVKPPKR